MQIGKKGQPGFALLWLLVSLVLMGLMLSQAAWVYSQENQREREKELLKTGDKLREAIEQYYDQSPGLVKQHPSSLSALLNDSRFPNTKRHLRKIPRDPMTGSDDWGLILDQFNNIMGVYSLGVQRPIKRKNFPTRYKDFENKASYSEWTFAHSLVPLTDQ